MVEAAGDATPSEAALAEEGDANGVPGDVDVALMRPMMPCLWFGCPAPPVVGELPLDAVDSSLFSVGHSPPTKARAAAIPAAAASCALLYAPARASSESTAAPLGSTRSAMGRTLALALPFPALPSPARAALLGLVRMEAPGFGGDGLLAAAGETAGLVEEEEEAAATAAAAAAAPAPLLALPSGGIDMPGSRGGWLCPPTASRRFMPFAPGDVAARAVVAEDADPVGSPAAAPAVAATARLSSVSLGHIAKGRSFGRGWRFSRRSSSAAISLRLLPFGGPDFCL